MTWGNPEDVDILGSLRRLAGRIERDSVGRPPPPATPPSRDVLRFPGTMDECYDFLARYAELTGLDFRPDLTIVERGGVCYVGAEPYVSEAAGIKHEEGRGPDGSR